MLKDSIKEIAVEMQKSSLLDFMRASSISELIKKENLLLIRSVRQAVFEEFIGLLISQNFRGTLYLIGREEDKKYVEQYDNIKINLYAAPEEQRYSLDNTGRYIDQIKADGVCFLYQSKIQDDSLNLLKIMERMKCNRFAVSNQMEVFELERLERYLAGRQMYQELCNWYYFRNNDSFS